MKLAINNLFDELKPTLNCKVKDMVLLIWPNENGISETDVKVNFSLEFENKKNGSYTFFIKADGQTPSIKKEKVKEDYKLTDLPLREKLWKNKSFWCSFENMDYEKFLVNKGSKYEKIIGSTLNRIEILYFDDKENSPTGIQLSFSSGDDIYCLPGLTIGTILEYLPDDLFPSTIQRCKII
ncbi:MAG: hypothetical protein MH321_14165 [Leptospiraceae bacterium]|nr:hypothetical protein [Leptospiraceae bacterium]